MPDFPSERGALNTLSSLDVLKLGAYSVTEISATSFSADILGPVVASHSHLTSHASSHFHVLQNMELKKLDD